MSSSEQTEGSVPSTSTVVHENKTDRNDSGNSVAKPKSMQRDSVGDGSASKTSGSNILDADGNSDNCSSFDPPESQDSTLNRLATDMFKKTADYLQGELLLVQEDYKLLEKLNDVTATKYSDMTQIADNVAKNMKLLNQKYKDLEPMLMQIDQIEESVNKLEQAAYKLDNYSKRLEAKFKSLERR